MIHSRYDGLVPKHCEIVGYKDKSIEHMGSTIESMRSRLANKDKIEKLELKSLTELKLFFQPITK